MAAGTITLGLCLSLLWWLYRPMGDWLRSPLYYEGDGLWNLFVVKTVIENGWYGANPMLGAPYGAQLLDFAKPELLFLAFHRLAGVFTHDVALIHNLFYLLGFACVALSALMVLRDGFRLHWPLAVAGALLYAFLPYHFVRLPHMFLSNYLAVPVAVWLVLRVAGERPPFLERGHWGPSSWRVWLACAVVASTSIYYAFFGLVLVAATGLMESLRRAVWQPLKSATATCLLVGGLVVLNLAPTLLYQHREGPNPAVAGRDVRELDLYALQPVQLLLPSGRHRAAPLAGITHRYNAQALNINENTASALGMLGSAGFLALLIGLLVAHPLLNAMPPLGVAARANAVALALAVTGGGGMLLALLVSPQFRALNRISVVIAFLALAALLMIVQHGVQRRAARVLAAALLLPLGLWDQVPAAVAPQRQATVAAYKADRHFVRRLEAIVPQGSAILQWPHVGFPEAPQLHQEGHYAHLRGYLHSTHLRWSYGGMVGRESDLWLRQLATLPVQDMARAAADRGFAGIWLNRRALPDGGAATAAALRSIGVVRTLDNADRSIAFFSLKPLVQPTRDHDLTQPTP
ncbi:hypothetical protein [Hydrogenophaga pseudoflava]|uniref:hypothetical protein n=1 Tax=Hydrogenophaga pseudoflava TaxID=47421 RepID=UPI0027E48437|nr:hypothetical protein [Hydrogenophaga pseudoflava]MDQ7743551.1 hypothetical protein [Hydrogenophaga pseudoflava]